MPHLIIYVKLIISVSSPTDRRYISELSSYSVLV